MAQEWSIQIFPEMFLRLINILKAPYEIPSMLWIIIPIVLSMVIILTYTSRYRREGGDYLTALSNSVFLIFVSAHLLSYLISNGIFGADMRTSVVFFVVVIGASLIIIDFFHLLPAKTIYRFSSKALFYFMAYSAVVLSYTDILVRSENTLYNIITTTIALAIFYFIFQMMILTIRLYVPPAKDATEAIMSKTESELQEIAHKGIVMSSSQGEKQFLQSQESDEATLDMQEESKSTQNEQSKQEQEDSNLDDLASGSENKSSYLMVEDDIVTEERSLARDARKADGKIEADSKPEKKRSSTGIQVFGSDEEEQSEPALEALDEDEPSTEEDEFIEGPIDDQSLLLTAQFRRAGPKEEDESEDSKKSKNSK